MILPIYKMHGGHSDFDGNGGCVGFSPCFPLNQTTLKALHRIRFYTRIISLRTFYVNTASGFL